MSHYFENPVCNVWLWLATARRSCQVDRPLSKVGMHVILGKAVGTIRRTRLDPWSASTCCSPSQGRPSCPQGSLL